MCLTEAGRIAVQGAHLDYNLTMLENKINLQDTLLDHNIGGESGRYQQRVTRGGIYSTKSRIWYYGGLHYPLSNIDVIRELQ